MRMRNALLFTSIQFVILIRASNGDMTNCLNTEGSNTCSCCKSGYRGPKCSDVCQNCLTRNVPGKECTHYCVTGHYGKTCDKKCPDTCADGNTGKHLCKEKYGLPVCVECIPGFHGKKCDQTCDTNCLNEKCYQTDGKCLSCSSDEFYGDHCSLPCNQGCVSGTCNRTGNCTDGCKIGFYGERCEFMCGSNCKHGKCTSHEYHAYNCTVGCNGGYWGTSCLEECPNHCTKCEQQNGTCTSCRFQELETGECVKEKVKEKVEEGKTAVPVVGNVVTVVIVVIVVTVLGIIFTVIWIKRRHRHHDQPETSETGDNIPLLPVNKEAYTYPKVDQIANSILKRVKCNPTVGIIFGFGLDQLANGLEDEKIINYKDIEGFPVSAVPDHENVMVFGRLGGKVVVVMPGLAHSLEDYSLEKITLPVRTMELMGVKTLFVINAAGGINTHFKVGDVMIIKDHLNLSRAPRVHPLQGMQDERVGPRFSTMHGTYDNDLRDLAKSVVGEMGTINVFEGVYTMICGPSFETATECKFLQSIGVDAIGMSHIPEVVEARQCNMKVFGLTLITNMCVMDFGIEDIDIKQAIIVCAKSDGYKLQEIVTNMISKL